VTVIADEAVRQRTNYVLASTRVGHFVINANSGRDFKIDMFADIAAASGGAACARCGNDLRAIRGTEVGHIFKLGTCYAEAFGAQIRGAGADKRPLMMGCYGLGVTRMMATIAEQGRDARGIVWPVRVAPYPAVVLPRDAQARRAAEQLHADLGASGVDVLLDDTGGSVEESESYADLLGMPLKIFVSGRRSDEQVVAMRERTSSETREVDARAVESVVRARVGP
jgi:prolyl-tRNA synthetase